MSAPKLNKNHFKHGFSHTRIDNIYKSMISRCYKPTNNRFDIYGGRGITVCEEWLNNKTLFFEWAFSNGYKDDLTLERINVDKNYEPSNCRWVTYKEQSNNRRNNKIISYNGLSHTIAEWGEILGINPATLYARLQRGWTVEQTLNSPLRR